MDVTDRISALIFALIVMAVCVYLVMSGYVVGPVAQAQARRERYILAVGLVGVGGVIVYAARSCCCTWCSDNAGSMQ